MKQPRSFAGICENHGIRKIRPPRDAQQIYTHVDEAARLAAITKLNELLGGAE